jgi:hypothetical protein
MSNKLYVVKTREDDVVVGYFSNYESALLNLKYIYKKNRNSNTVDVDPPKYSCYEITVYNLVDNEYIIAPETHIFTMTNET